MLYTNPIKKDQVASVTMHECGLGMVELKSGRWAIADCDMLDDPDIEEALPVSTYKMPAGTTKEQAIAKLTKIIEGSYQW